MVEGIPGSSPDWRGANMKTKGRAAPAEVPPAELGATAHGLAAWGSRQMAQQKARRHYHQSQLAQTTAWDCLPCVDAVHKPQLSASCPSTSSTKHTQSSSQSGAETSLSLLLANRQWRRHRREVPAPPCTEKPQGKRMLHTSAPPSTCKELLKDPAPPVLAPASSTAAAHAVALAAGSSAASPGQCQAPVEHDCAQRSSSSSSRPAVAKQARSMSTTASSSSTSGSRGSQVVAQPGACTPTTAAQSEGQAAAAARAKKAGRVEDDPQFFRTPKDPPTLQRFAQSLAQMSLGQGSTLGTVQRHEAGIRARQQAQVAAAARGVAALDAGAQHDAD